MVSRCLLKGIWRPLNDILRAWMKDWSRMLKLFLTQILPYDHNDNPHSTFGDATSEWKLDWNGERQKSAIQKEDLIYLLTFTIWYSLPWLCGCTFKMTSSCIIYAWAVIWQLSFYSFSSSFLVFHKDFAASGAQGP